MYVCMHACMHAYIYIYIYIYIHVNQIKTANNAFGDLVFLYFFVNLVMRLNGHVCFFNSLNKMTNAAYENAMRRCPRN